MLAKAARRRLALHPFTITAGRRVSPRTVFRFREPARAGARRAGTPARKATAFRNGVLLPGAIMDSGVQTQEQRLSDEGCARQRYYFEQAVQAARSGPWDSLKGVRGGVWARFSEGKLTEGQVGYLVEILEARLKPAEKPPAKARNPDSFVGSRPITPESLERRRRLSRETFVHPQDSEELTNGEAAVLSIVLEEVMKLGRCLLPVGKIAALAGVSRRWAQHALRKLESLLYLCVQIRPGDRRRHETSVVTLHPSRGALRGRLEAVKKWWRGRGGLQGIGRSLVRTTRLKTHERHPASRDNTVERAPSAPMRLGGRSTARPVPT
ncbi:hypothetical protein [Enterovirga rhinocerotis]|uniref:Uncharacterized protein n=1 Tax=Enterovirga rhinocerotis TaxID=1339210 RepID=A0A4R7C888_9HYPH|nr:hypothetical protein [Enterovirga rhinocerotis]TDR94182.1 hypothetical protein EV668_1460 [Enterovirga rhinocerotis]